MRVVSVLRDPRKRFGNHRVGGVHHCMHLLHCNAARNALLIFTYIHFDIHTWAVHTVRKVVPIPVSCMLAGGLTHGHASALFRSWVGRNNSPEQDVNEVKEPGSGNNSNVQALGGVMVR